MKKLDYVEVGGILYPDLHVNVKEFGYFGTKKMEYMKMYHPDEYVILMAKGTLFDYLEQIDIQANDMYDRLVDQYKETKKYNRRTKNTRSNAMGTRNE